MVKNGILGHQKQVRKLEIFLESQNVPNVMLLLGESRIGKRCVTLDFLCKYFNRKGQLVTSEQIESNSVRDVHFYGFPGEKNILVDNVRDIRTLAGQPPFGASFKWLVIDEAERFTQESSNALLKVFEDTAKDTKFILIAGDEDKILDTIKGRAFIVRFFPIPRAEIEQCLGQEGYASQDIYVAAILAEGSLSKARNLIQDKSKMELVEAVSFWMESWYLASLPEIWASIDKIVAKYDRGEIFATLRSVVADIWQVYSCSKPVASPFLDQESAAKSAKGLTSKGLEYILQRVEDLEHINVSMNDAVQLKSLFFELNPVRITLTGAVQE